MYAVVRPAMPAPTMQTSAVASRVSGEVEGWWAVSIQSDVLFGIVGRSKQEEHRTAGQGGPKTLPAAFWQAVLARRLLWRNPWGGGPAALGDRAQHYKEHW